MGTLEIRYPSDRYSVRTEAQTLLGGVALQEKERV